MTIKEAETIFGHKIYYYHDTDTAFLCIPAPASAIVKHARDIGPCAGVSPVVYIIDKKTKVVSKTNITLYNHNSFPGRTLDLSIDKDFMSQFLPAEPKCGEDNFYAALKNAFEDDK